MIRQDIILDPTKGIKGLNEFERAAIKSARKQERQWEETKQSINAIESELRTLKQARDAANDPRVVKKYQAAINKLEGEQKELRRETSKYGETVQKESNKAQSSFKKIGTAVKAWIAGVAITAFYGLQRAIRAVINVTADFEQSMAEVSTLVDTTEVSMSRLEEGIQGISTEVSGVAYSNLPKALYQTISAGIDAADALDVVRVAAESSVAGVTQVSTAVDGLTTVINAWDLEASDATDVSDAFFIAVREGKTTFDELSQSIGRAAPLAATAGSSFETLLSAVAALTTSGLNTREAMTAVRGIFQKILKPTQQAKDAAKELGIEFNQAALKSKGLYQFLQDVAEAADGDSETIGRLFEDVEALNGVLSLTGGASEAFAGNLEDMSKKAGSTAEAFGKMEGNFNNLYQLFKNKLNVVMTKFGETILPNIIAHLKQAGRYLDEWQESARRESVIQGSLSSIGGMYDSGLSGFSYVALEQELNRLYDAQKKNTEAFNQQNRALAENIESYSTWASGVGDSKAKIADATEELKFREFALKKNIERANEAISSDQTSVQEKARLNVKLAAQQQRLESVREALRSVTNAQEEANNQTSGASGGGGGTVDYLQQVYEQYDKIIDLQRQLDFTDIIAGDADTSKLREVAMLTGQFAENVKKMGASDIIQSHMREATDAVEKYNQELSRLNNLRSLGKDNGGIGDAEYQRRVNEATQKYFDKLKGIYKLIKEHLGPEGQEFFESLFDNFPDASKETEDFKTNLDDIADVADSLINVADAFGAIGENARKSLSGISDVLRNLQKMKELGPDAGILESALPAIGIAGGVMSVIGGIIGGNEQERAHRRELINQLSSLEREIRKNTEAILKEALVGSGVSQKQITSADELISDLRELFKFSQGDLDITDITGGDSVQNRLAKIFEELSSLGIEAFEGFDIDLLKSLIAEKGISNIDEVIKELLEGGDGFTGVEEILSRLAGNLGQFGDSLEGAIERLNITTKLGADQEQAFDAFIQDVIGLVGGENELTDLLKQVANAETEKERKDLAHKIFEAFQDNPALLGGDLTGSDLQEIIDVILGQGDGASGSASSDYSRSTQIANSITEIQANEMLFFLERIEAWTRSLAANFGDEVAASLPNNNGIAKFNIPIPLPVKVVNDLQGNPMQDISDKIGGPLHKNMPINIGDVNLSNGITEADIDEVTRAINNKLKQEMRGGRF